MNAREGRTRVRENQKEIQARLTRWCAERDLKPGIDGLLFKTTTPDALWEAAEIETLWVTVEAKAIRLMDFHAAANKAATDAPTEGAAP